MLTVRYAVAAVSLSLAAGLVLGVLASVSWYRFLLPRGNAARALGTSTYLATRLWIAFTRSIHELLWAILLLAAFGAVPAVAVIAIAIPYSGTFAKVFSEMLDESPPAVAEFLESSGASRAKTFLFGLVPQAWPGFDRLFALPVRMRPPLGGGHGVPGDPDAGSVYSSSRLRTSISTRSGLTCTPSGPWSSGSMSGAGRSGAAWSPHNFASERCPQRYHRPGDGS